MERQYRLEGGGSLTVRADGLRAVLEAERPADGRGLYKAYLRGPSGRVLLGTLAPEGARLRVRRTLTLDALERQGGWPPVGAELELAFPFGGEKVPAGWRRADPGRLSFGEPALQAMAARQGDALYREDGAGFTLACPFSCDRPFPLPALFCLSRPVRLGEEWYVLFRFGADGWPASPECGGKVGVC